MPTRDDERPEGVLRFGQLQPVVGTQPGEIEVSVTNRTRRAWHDVDLFVRESVAGRASPHPRFAVIPSEADGGYRLDEVPAEQTVSRTFSLRPAHAEVGSVTTFEATLDRDPVKNPKRPPRGAPVAAAPSAWINVTVEASAESYATIGAVEWAREKLVGKFQEFEARGRKAQQDRKLRWPANDADPADFVLGEKSFRALFEVVEIGARLASRLGRKRDDEG